MLIAWENAFAQTESAVNKENHVDVEDYWYMEALLTPSLFAFSFLVAWAAGWLMALSNKSTKPIRHGFYYAGIASSVMVLLVVSL